MKKNLRTFLIMLLVLALLGGGAAALLLTQPQEEEAEESSSSQVREALLGLDPEEVSSVKVKNSFGEFTLKPLSQEEAEEEESSSEEVRVTGRSTFHRFCQKFSSVNWPPSRTNSGR